ncbi:hypothetical protein [Burkholderia multivorans]|nr:hypothetical protein [Burkholderia multivorans]MBU9525023.1 hypothetical protein [Burkholderia multivorans]MBU9537030.1 hypothetical protein [Burkholderia multivorans]MBU9635460.1 hypothetical protein [Burkholderia multivorans]
MNIEITEAMHREIVKQVSANLLDQVRKQINPQRLADEIRVQVRAELVSKIAGDVHRKLNQTDFVEEALRDAEQRINARIEKAIAAGVTLRIALTDREA